MLTSLTIDPATTTQATTNTAPTLTNTGTAAGTGVTSATSATSRDGSMHFAGTKPTRVGRTTYTYDEAGRVVRTVTKRLSRKPLVHEFFYATSEQPIGFTSSDTPGVGWRYIYDAFGRRVAKETINTATGDIIHRTVFAHVGNQLVAETTTHTTNDAPAGVGTSAGTRVGEGYLWTTDPATGDIIGQTRLTGSTTSADSTTTRAGGHPENLNGDDADAVGQAAVDAKFFALVTDLAGSPQEIINPTTGNIAGTARHSLYGTRTWTGNESSPLLFAGQYLDDETGWAYNRFRYYQPNAGIYNAQDPLGLAPRIAGAQGYVDHAAYWVDVLGLLSCIINNAIKGRKFEKLGEGMAEAMLKNKNTLYADQVTVRVANAEGKLVRSRVDMILRDPSTGRMQFIEFKTGNAQLTKNQATLQSAINNGGSATLRSRSRADALNLRHGNAMKGDYHVFRLDTDQGLEDFASLLMKMN